MSLHGCSSNCPDTQAAGKYVKNCTSSSSGYCVPCPAGTYKVGISETKSCSVCQWSARKGHYREGCGGTSAGWTEPCPLGTYQPIHLGRWNRLHRRSTGQQACLQCPVGKHSGLRLGASECIDCGQNWPTELDEQCSAASAPTATSEAAAQPGTDSRRQRETRTESLKSPGCGLGQPSKTSCEQACLLGASLLLLSFLCCAAMRK